MVQQNERFSERVVFYVMPSVRARLDNAVGASGMQHADWLRQCLEEALVRVESEALLVGNIAGGDESGMPLASQLAAAEARVQGLEEIVAILRERLGMADAHNLELNKRLRSRTRLLIGLCWLCPWRARVLSLGAGAGSSGRGDGRSYEEDWGFSATNSAGCLSIIIPPSPFLITASTALTSSTSIGSGHSCGPPAARRNSAHGDGTAKSEDGGGPIIHLGCG